MEKAANPNVADAVPLLERAIQASCGALLCADLPAIEQQIVETIDLIRAAIIELRPARPESSRLATYGFVMSWEPVKPAEYETSGDAAADGPYGRLHPTG